MSTRLQVVMSEEEVAQLRRQAQRQGLTLSEWVRQALREAAARGPAPSAEQRLEGLRRALKREHPTGDIEQMLGEIERGRALR